MHILKAKSSSLTKMTVNLLLSVIVGQPLKVRVFVTLCAPIVIKLRKSLRARYEIT